MNNRNVSSIKDYVVQNIRNELQLKTDEHRKKELHKKGREHLKLFEFVNVRERGEVSHAKFWNHLRSEEASKIVKSYKKDLLYLGLLGAIEERTFIQYSHRHDFYDCAGEIYLVSSHHTEDNICDYFQEDAPRSILWNLLTFLVLTNEIDIVEKAEASYHRYVEYKRFPDDNNEILYVPATEVYLWKFIEDMGFELSPGTPAEDKGITLRFHNFGEDE